MPYNNKILFIIILYSTLSVVFLSCYTYKITRAPRKMYFIILSIEVFGKPFARLSYFDCETLYDRLVCLVKRIILMLQI